VNESKIASVIDYPFYDENELPKKLDHTRDGWGYRVIEHQYPKAG
jgi:hypothetical protein